MTPDRFAIWNSFQSDLRKFVFSKVKDKAVTDDIVHDVFLKTHEKIDSLKDHSKVRSWLFTLTHNTIIDHFRTLNRQVDPHLLDVKEEDGSNFNECVSRYVKKLIRTLPEKYRQAIQLTDLGEMSQIHLAGFLGISVSGAKSRVQRARAMLKKKLQEDLSLQTDRYGNVLTCACQVETSS